MASHITPPLSLLLLVTLAAALILPSPTLACPTCPTVTPPPPPPKTTSTPCPPPPAPKNSPPKYSPPKYSPPKYSPPTVKGCPIDILKLDACVSLLGGVGGLLHVVIGQDVKSKCCPLLQGVADADAALCLCTTIKAKVLNIELILPIAIELLLDCGKHVPANYQCPA